MSSDLVWQVIRKNNAFKRRQRGIQKHFSVEKFNLRAVHSQRHSGLASRKALDVQPSSDGKSILLSVKQPKNRFRPRISTKTVSLKKKQMKSISNAAKSLGLGKSARTAQRRAAALLRSQRPRVSKKKTDA
ncbi:hypothetical protein WR25_16615 [Diploscapter pachys]|uniref:Large ribosomal subunit protein eL28 n=1 Tax=Diploscapter pachys TaxID=2018661 RepID=A0A2A2L5L5_9BILA|nr:hypothetical protein WR25_16615 [Diploscapter pachys]